ncbi:MAG TPA: hypothetical protein VHK27_06110 [Gammaproteobacteria bacterium]|nr:hypothetical protein [Gammaproteobacteria bacterium]
MTTRQELNFMARVLDYTVDQSVNGIEIYRNHSEVSIVVAYDGGGNVFDVKIRDPHQMLESISYYDGSQWERADWVRDKLRKYVPVSQESM